VPRSVADKFVDKYDNLSGLSVRFGKSQIVWDLSVTNLYGEIVSAAQRAMATSGPGVDGGAEPGPPRRQSPRREVPPPSI